MKTTQVSSSTKHALVTIASLLATSVSMSYGEPLLVNHEEACDIVAQALSEFGGGYSTNYLEITAVNPDTIVVGYRADTNNCIRPPLPDAPYCFRVWVDRNTRQILPSPTATSSGLSVSNVLDIVRNEEPSFSYATNRVVTQLHLSETTLTRFPAWKPEIPPGYGWLGPDFASILWIDNATSNILLWLVGK